MFSVVVSKVPPIALVPELGIGWARHLSALLFPVHLLRTRPASVASVVKNSPFPRSPSNSTRDCAIRPFRPGRNLAVDLGRSATTLNWPELILFLSDKATHFHIVNAARCPEPVQFVPVVNTLHPFDVAQIFVPVKTLARQSGRTP